MIEINQLIKVGDIITKFNGKKISGTDELSSLIVDKKPGDKVTVTVWRDKKTSDLTLVLTTAPNQ